MKRRFSLVVGGVDTRGEFKSLWCIVALRSLRIGCVGLLILIGSMLMHGCLILPVPTPEHGLSSGRGEIAEADTAFLVVGTTTREDVMLRFGEPSASLNSQQTFVYHWQTARGYIFAGLIVPIMPGGAADAGAITKDYLFLLEFDEQNRLTRFEKASLGLFESLTKRLDQLSSP